MQVTIVGVTEGSCFLLAMGPEKSAREPVHTRPNQIREVNAARAKSNPHLLTISDRCMSDGERR